MGKRPNVAEHLVAIAKALQPLGIRWYVFGAQAVIFAGFVRATADIDITTEDVDVRRLEKALGKAGFVVRRDIEGVEELIEHHRVLPMEHAKTGMQLDVVRAGPGLEEAMLERRVVRRVGRARLPFASTNDLLVLKILAGREKDLEDVRGLLRSKSDEIDLDVVRHRLDELGSAIDDRTLRSSFDEQVNATTRLKTPTRSTRTR